MDSPNCRTTQADDDRQRTFRVRLVNVQVTFYDKWGRFSRPLPEMFLAARKFPDGPSAKTLKRLGLLP